MIVLLMLSTMVMICLKAGELKRYDVGLILAFWTIFLFLALRFDYGNDYDSYLFIYNRIIRYDVGTFQVGFDIEPGWVIINQLFGFFGDFGFYYMIAFLSAIYCLVYYFFVRIYVEPKYYWFSLFFLIWNFSLMMMNLSMIPNSVAACLFLIAFYLLNKDKYLWFYLIVIFASTIHTTALMMIVVPLLKPFFNIRFTYKDLIPFLILYVLIAFLGYEFQGVVEGFLGLLNERYKEYLVVKEIGTGMSTIYYFVLLSIAVTYDKWLPRELSPYNKLYIISLLIFPLSLVGPVRRLVQYFVHFQIVLIPFYMSINRRQKIPYVFSVMLYFFYITTSVIFMSRHLNSEIWFESFSEYHTVFDLNL